MNAICKLRINPPLYNTGYVYSIVGRNLSGKRKPDALSGNSVYLAEAAAKILFQAKFFHRAYDDTGSGGAGRHLLTVHRQSGVPPPGFILLHCRSMFIISLPQRLNPLISLSVMKGASSRLGLVRSSAFNIRPVRSGLRSPEHLGTK